MNIRILIASLLLFSSCSNARENRTVKLILQDSLVDAFPYLKEGKTVMVQPIHYMGKEWLLYGNTKSGTTLLSGIGHDNHGQSLMMDGFTKTINNRQYASAFYSADSIWVYFYGSNTISLMNLDGKILKDFSVNTSYNGIELFLYGGYYHNPLFYNPATRNLYFTASFGASGSVSNFFKKPRFAVLAESRDHFTISNLYGPYPNYKDEQFYGLSTSWHNVVMFNNKLFASYYLSDSLYEYTLDGAYKTKCDAHSKYIVKNTDTFELTKDGDRDYISEFSSLHPTYNYLLANAYSDYLFRICYHQYNYYNADSTINKSIDRPWSMIILDKQSKIVDEIKFEAGAFSSTFIVPYKNGFWIKSLKNKNIYFYEIQ